MHHLKVDTILYYHSYCGNCEILGSKHVCKADYGYNLINNVILYRQNGNFYSLDFDCYDLPIKKRLDSCKSIPYSTSIIPILNSRNKTIKAIYKKGKFLGPTQTDGTFQKIDIYLNKQRQFVSMSESEKTRFYDVYKKYYWIDSEIELLKLVSEDLAVAQ